MEIFNEDNKDINNRSQLVNFILTKTIFIILNFVIY